MNNRLKICLGNELWLLVLIFPRKRVELNCSFVIIFLQKPSISLETFLTMFSCRNSTFLKRNFFTYCRVNSVRPAESVMKRCTPSDSQREQIPTMLVLKTGFRQSLKQNRYICTNSPITCPQNQIKKNKPKMSFRYLTINKLKINNICFLTNICIQLFKRKLASLYHKHVFRVSRI